MSRLVGYMLTWTTYGSWICGDRRGYVQKGEILNGSAELRSNGLRLMKGEEFLLNEEQKQVVRDSILTASDKWGQEVLALAVCARHIHLVLRKNEKSVEEAAGYYKNAGRVGLGEFGVVGRVWSRGYDKRFCFTEGELVGRVRYVERHLG